MTWFKVDDTLAFHHKVVAAGVSAMGLWVRAGSWCAQTLTDGFVPEHMVPALADGDAGLAERLVEAKLWRRVKGGFAFHEWAERQPSRQSIEDRRAVRADAGRKGGVRSGQVRARGGSKPEASASSKPEASASAGLEPPTRPDPSLNGHLGGEALETYEDDLPPPKIGSPPESDPANPRCAEHAHIPANQRGPNCGRCAAVREQLDRQHQTAHLEQVMITRRCGLCDADGWRYEANSRVPVTPYVRCEHRPLRSVG